MRMDFLTFGFAGFKVFDLGTGTYLDRVMWVDDTALEYATLSDPVVIEDDQFKVDVHKVSSVRVDYVNRVITVDSGAGVWPFPTTPAKEGKACDECCQPETCKRIDYCARYKCRFGEARKP